MFTHSTTKDDNPDRVIDWVKNKSEAMYMFSSGDCTQGRSYKPGIYEGGGPYKAGIGGMRLRL